MKRLLQGRCIALDEEEMDLGRERKRRESRSRVLRFLWKDCQFDAGREGESREL